MKADPNEEMVKAKDELVFECGRLGIPVKDGTELYTGIFRILTYILRKL